jgi:hypothetical protein
MATQPILLLVIFMASFASSILLMVEIVVWVMGRLDNPRASKGRKEAIEPQLVSTLQDQEDLARSYPHKGYIVSTAEANPSGYTETSAPLFQLLEKVEELPCQVRFNVSPASRDTWVPVELLDEGGRVSTQVDM